MVDITLWYAVGTLGMVVGTAMLTYGLVLVPGEKRGLLAWMVSVPAIATVAYGSMALGLGSITTGSGTLVFVPRYVDWLVTTPIHAAVIALVVGAGRSLVARVAGLQALTIVFGFLGTLVGAPLNWALFLLGSACFGGVVYTFYVDLDDLAVEGGDEAETLFRKLRAFVVVLWLVYPAIWVLAPPGVGVMDGETTALVVSYIDVVAKVGFGLIAINEYVTLAAVEGAVADSDDAPSLSADD
jgi:sensory rhodopsin